MTLNEQAARLADAMQDNAAAPPSSENCMQDQTHSGGAPPKKPQKTARSQNRHRNEPGNDYPWREDRADPWVGRVDTNNRGGRVGPVSARDGSFARQGFWDWSR